jgi:Rhs element Vgr protein
MNDRVLPQPAESDLPTVKVLSGGNEINREFHLLRLVVSHEANRIPAAQLTLLDGDAAAEDFPISNGGEFAPGKEIEILVGYHGNDKSIFKGIVTRHGLRSRAGQSPILHVVCKDPAVKMTVARRSAVYTGMTESDVWSELIEAYGLTADSQPTSATRAEMTQYDCTDWDFLVARAEINGMLVFARDGTLAVKKPDPGQTPVLTLRFGATILEMDVDLDAERQLGVVKTVSWDYAAQETVESEGADPGFPEQGNVTANEIRGVLGVSELRLHHGGALAEEELQAWGDGVRARSSLAKILGRLRCQGYAGVKPGDVIELAGIGERFNGNAYVTAIRHEVSASNWVTDLQIGLFPTPFHQEPGVQAPAAAGVLPGIPGLQMGVVTHLAEDPNGEHRIQVRLPLVDAEQDGLWARVCTLDAGNERGTFVRPEIGDEVVVGFLHADPRHPVVLGMLHSSAKPAPLAASDENPKKGYFSRSKIKLTLDDEAKVLTVQMPSGRELKLDDDAGEIVVQDGDGNTVTLNGGGISVKAAGDLALKADGNIIIEGTNVDLKAGGAFKAEGSTGSEVSSGGTTTVKGSLVQIN